METNKKRNNVLFFILIVIIIGIVITIILLSGHTSSLNVKYGDSTTGWTLSNSNNKTQITSDEAFSGYNIIFYLSESCHPCIEELPSINIINTALNDASIESYIIWRKSVPTNINEDVSLNNFSLKGTELCDTNPVFYIIEDNIVVFMTQDLDTLIQRIKRDCGTEYVQRSILNKYSERINSESNYFYLIFLDENDESYIDQLDDRIKLNEYFLVTNSYSKDSRYMYDPKSLIIKLFDITEYPTALKVDKKTFEWEILVNI